MYAFTAIVALFAGSAMALPATLVARAGVCQDTLYSVPQCCATNVLDVASLDCSVPSSANDAADFSASCGASGAQAQCCTVPVASQGVLCIAPVGV
ncbi:hypothetical protein ACHAQA_003289 [Verticillium albo-atrum]